MGCEADYDVLGEASITFSISNTINAGKQSVVETTTYSYTAPKIVIAAEVAVVTVATVVLSPIVTLGELIFGWIFGTA